MYAHSLFAAAICREQVSSFILGVFFVGGLVYLILVLKLQPPLDLLVPIEIFAHYASPKYWMNEFASGKLDIAVLLYF